MNIFSRKHQPEMHNPLPPDSLAARALGMTAVDALPIDRTELARQQAATTADSVAVGASELAAPAPKTIEIPVGDGLQQAAHPLDTRVPISTEGEDAPVYNGVLIDAAVAGVGPMPDNPLFTPQRPEARQAEFYRAQRLKGSTEYLSTIDSISPYGAGAVASMPYEAIATDSRAPMPPAEAPAYVPAPVRPEQYN